VLGRSRAWSRLPCRGLRAGMSATRRSQRRLTDGARRA
jgi:hypothetical protein